MVQSLGKAWKQPVAYYFSEGDTPGQILKDSIVGVISELQEIRFDVRASVSDQGGNTCAIGALRSRFQPEVRSSHVTLCDDSKKKRKTVTVGRKATRAPGERSRGTPAFSRQDCAVCRANSIRPAEVTFYRINKPHIYHFWNVPHLLKNLRNNFKNYNVEFEPGKVAKWDHLKQLHDQEGIDGTFYHITLKLTNRHLQNYKNGDEMKISLAAQI